MRDCANVSGGNVQTPDCAGAGRASTPSSPAITFSFLLGLLAGACSPADAPPRGAARTGEDTLVALVWGGDRALMPWVGMPTMHLMFEPLFGWDRDGNVEGRLVRAWEHSPDGRTWTYHLRTDVRWHDGVPFTTRDIEFTRRLNADNPLARSPDSLVVLDDSTFQRVFREAGEPLDDWNVFLPKHLLEDLDATESWEWEFNFEPGCRASAPPIGRTSPGPSISSGSKGTGRRTRSMRTRPQSMKADDDSNIR